MNSPIEKQDALAEVGGKRYYKGDALGLTWAERWRICPNILVFFIYALLCLLRLRFGGKFALAYPCQILGVNEDELSKEAREEIGKSDEAWDALGFRRDRLYSLELLGREELIGITYLNSEDPKIMGSAIYYRMLFRNVETLRVIQSVSSSTESGLSYSTLNSKRELEGPPEFRRQYMKDEDVPGLLTAHRRRLDESTETFQFLNKELVGGLLVKWNNRETEFQAARGFYVQASNKLIEELRTESSQNTCIRCGDFLGETRSIDHPGYCKACHPFRAEEEKKEFEKSRAGAHTILGLLAGLAGGLFFIWEVKSRGMLNSIHLVIALIFGLIVFLVVIVLGRLLDRLFKRDKRKKIRM